MRVQIGNILVTERSHTDHAIPLRVGLWALAQPQVQDAGGFFLATLDLPRDMPTLPCAIHGPIVGEAPVREDEVYYARRGDRPGESRMLRSDSSRPPATTRKVTVIVGPGRDDGGALCLWTLFGGPAAPREPFDPRFAGGAYPSEYSESVGFWAEHALRPEQG